MSVFVAVLLATSLGAPFGDASATPIEVGDNRMVVELRVTVPGGDPSVVVALAAGVTWTLEPSALALEDGGVWAGLVEIPVLENARVAFEALFSDGTSRRSPTVSLIDLGLGADVFVAPDTVVSTTGAAAAETEGEPDQIDRSLLWLAVAAGAGALSLVAFWALGDGRAGSQEPETAGSAETDDKWSEYVDNSATPDHSGDHD